MRSSVRSKTPNHQTVDEIWFTSPYFDPTRLVVAATSRPVYCRHLIEAGSSVPFEVLPLSNGQEGDPQVTCEGIQ